MKNVKLLLITILAISWCSNLLAESDKEFKKINIGQVNNIYFTIKPDLRKCISPICGGWYVNPVNRRAMRCPDGAIRKQCYAGTDEIKIPNLSSEQLAQLRQAMSESRVLIQGTLSSSIEYGLLIINDAWLSATEQTPKGKFLSVSDNGMRCITYPCLNLDAVVLNRHLLKTLASYDLSGVNADEEQLDRAHAAVLTDEGLHLAGKVVEVTGPAGSAQGVAATQFYLKLEGEKPKMCMPTGCSGQVCSDGEVITTCEWKPEYECYRAATCTTQDNGECGWTMDEELKRCLANAVVNKWLQ